MVTSWHVLILFSIAGPAAAAAARTARNEAQGAWAVLKEVAACEPAAPSWQFLRTAWAHLQEQGRAAAGACSLVLNGGVSVHGACVCWMWVCTLFGQCV